VKLEIWKNYLKLVGLWDESESTRRRFDARALKCLLWK